MNIDYDKVTDWNEVKAEAQKELNEYEVKNADKYPEVIKNGKFFNCSSWTDVYPCVVAEIINEKKIVVETLEHIGDRSAESGVDTQNWIIYYDPNRTQRKVFTKRKNGRWVEQGNDMNHGLKGSLNNKPCYYYDWTF